MKRIGLVGEDPNDTYAIEYLLRQHYGGNVQLKPILRNTKGHQLDSVSALKALKAELYDERFDVIVFIRDLDGLETEKRKVERKLSWFKKVNTISNNKGVLLLNIYELEALILADINTFNTIYKTAISNIGNVMFQTKPKEFLIWKTYSSKKTYHESHCPDLFKKLSHKTIQNNCKYYKDFIGELDRRLARSSSNVRI